MKAINPKNNQQGAILLVVLLIMFGIVATTASMAFIIINEIQQSRDVDYSIIAYYAGETAVEQGLFQMRKNEEATIHGLNISGETFLDNTASWTRTATNEVSQMSVMLEKDKSLTVDFYNFDDPAQDPDLGSIKISGTDDTAWLETTLLTWPVGLDITWGSQLPQSIFKGMFPLDGADICLSEPTATQAYQLRLKAFYDDIQDNLTVTGWSGDACLGNSINILGLVTITGIGKYKHSTQAVQVFLPRRAPLSGVYDYIVFGSEPVVK